MASYTVQSGDSYWAIARSLGIDPIALLQLNNLTMADVQAGNAELTIGSTIQVPASNTGETGETEEIGDDAYEFDPEDWEAPTDDFDWIAPTSPVDNLITDPAYAAFLGQYNMDVGQIEQTAITQRSLLEGGMRSQLGALMEEGADPYDPSAGRTGGLFELGESRQIKQTADTFAGKGMAFGGGRRKQEANVATDWATQEEQYWQNVRGQKSQIDQDYIDRRRQLEIEKLAEESSAYQRRVTEDITSQYG
jgi:hypothetical protein